MKLATTNPVLRGVTKNWDPTNIILNPPPPLDPPIETGPLKPSPITYRNIANKTALSVATIGAATSLDSLLCTVNPTLGLLCATAGFAAAIIVFAVSLVIWIKKKNPIGPEIALSFATAEGLTIGGAVWSITTYINPWVAIQALAGTIGVFVTMLVLYCRKKVTVTPRFRKILVSSLAGSVALSIVSALVSIVTHNDVLNGNGPAASLFSLVIVVIMAFYLVSDFQDAVMLVEVGAPATCAWSIALGLSVSIIWLYTEMLNIFSNTKLT